MARTDKPKKDGCGTKKTKAVNVVFRQPLGEKGTFAAKTQTPKTQANPRAKKKGSKAKPKQPQPALPEDQFAGCENIQSDDFLFEDIDCFSDCRVEDDQTVTPSVVDEFENIVESWCLSPLQNLPEQPVDISNASHNDQGVPLLQSSPSSLRPLPKPLLASHAPPLQPLCATTLPVLPMPASTPPQHAAPLNSSQRVSHSAGCSARSQRLPAMDMFHLREPMASTSSVRALTSSSVASAQHTPLVAPPSAWTTQRTVVHTISPSPPQVFNSAVSSPPEQIHHQSRNLASGSVTTFKRPLPQPLPPSTHLFPQPQNVRKQLRKGARVAVTKGMHEGRRGIVRGVQRAGKKGPPIYGLWSVLLDGKDVVALTDEFLTLR